MNAIGLPHIIVFVYHLILFLLFIALYLTIKTEPGEIPFYWGFRNGDSDMQRRRYCLMCNVFKPERCHHCSICNKCILNMDHHCPWINTCIGYYNRKFFLQMLLYIILLSIYSNCINIQHFISSLKLIFKTQGTLDSSHLIYNFGLIFVYTLDLAAMVVISLFFKFHMLLVLDNKTTIETIDKKNLEFTSSFDLGKKKNFLQVFGLNQILWVFPFSHISGLPLGNGIDWEGK